MKDQIVLCHPSLVCVAPRSHLTVLVAAGAAAGQQHRSGVSAGPGVAERSGASPVMETIKSRNKSILEGPGIRGIKENVKGRPREAGEGWDEGWVTNDWKKCAGVRGG